MDAAGLLIGLMDILVGGLVILLAGPLIRGEIRMNRWYGVRVGRAFESEEKWVEINRYGGRQLRGWGFVVLTSGFAALLFDLGSDPALLILFVLTPLLLLIPALRAARYARRA